MSQTYNKDLPESGVTTFGELYQVIRDKDEALRSMFSGTSFPSEPAEGQPCYRTDRQKWYGYTGDTSLGENGWVEIASENEGLGAELINARGSKPSLDQRLDVALNEDGTLKANVEAYQSEWIKPSLNFTYVDSSSFKVEGDQTDIYVQYRALKFNHSTSSTSYSYVVSSSYSNDSNDETLVTVNDSVIQSDLVSVEHGLINADKTRDSLPRNINADTVDTFHASQTPQANTIPVTDANGELRSFTPYFAGFKNRIINGDFSIWQRGESASYASDAANLTAENGYKSADRIYCTNTNAGGQFTVSKSTMNNFNSFKVTVDSPPDDLTWDGTNKRYWNPYVYRFEGLHIADLFVKQSKITISFLFRSNVPGVFSLSFRKSGSPMDSFVTTFSYNDVDTVQKVVVTIPLDYNWSSGIVTDNSKGAELLLCGLGDCYSTSQIDTWQSGDYHSYSDCVNWAATAGNYIEIAELQLEEGEIATDFEHVPYDVQLMRCMRYYEIIENAIAWKLPYVDDTYGTAYFKVLKRTTPSITFVRPSDGTVGGGDYYWNQGSNKVSINFVKNNITCIAFGITNYDPPSDNDARLETHILADAEL